MKFALPRFLEFFSVHLDCLAVFGIILSLRAKESISSVKDFFDNLESSFSTANFDFPFLDLPSSRESRDNFFLIWNAFYDFSKSKVISSGGFFSGVNADSKFGFSLAGSGVKADSKFGFSLLGSGVKFYYNLSRETSFLSRLFSISY